MKLRNEINILVKNIEKTWNSTLFCQQSTGFAKNGGNRGAGLCGDTRSGVSWCHPLPWDASAAVTDLGVNYVQMQMEIKKKKVFTAN